MAARVGVLIPSTTAASRARRDGGRDSGASRSCKGRMGMSFVIRSSVRFSPVEFSSIGIGSVGIGSVGIENRIGSVDIGSIEIRTVRGIGSVRIGSAWFTQSARRSFVCVSKELGRC